MNAGGRATQEQLTKIILPMLLFIVLQSFLNEIR